MKAQVGRCFLIEMFLSKWNFHSVLFYFFMFFYAFVFLFLHHSDVVELLISLKALLFIHKLD